MTAIIDEKKAFVELRFGPNWEYISTVRNFIINFLAITIDDKKRADRIAMAVNELIENAIKYSDEDGIGINLEVMRIDNRIKVTVRNHATPGQNSILQTMLDEINSQNPLNAYIQRMRKSADSPEMQSTIGLARIRYETNAVVSHTYINNFITVYAEFTS